MGKIFMRSSIGFATKTHAAEGFSKQDLHAVSFLLEKLDCGLSVEAHQDYDGCLSLLVYSQRAAFDRAFFLHRSTNDIQLVDVSGDFYVPVGTFASFIGAITFIQRALAEGSRPSDPPSPRLARTSLEDGSRAAPGPRAAHH